VQLTFAVACESHLFYFQSDGGEELDGVDFGMFGNGIGRNHRRT